MVSSSQGAPPPRNTAKLAPMSKGSTKKSTERKKRAWTAEWEPRKTSRAIQDTGNGKDSKRGNGHETRLSELSPRNAKNGGVKHGHENPTERASPKESKERRRWNTTRTPDSELSGIIYIHMYIYIYIYILQMVGPIANFNTCLRV